MQRVPRGVTYWLSPTSRNREAARARTTSRWGVYGFIGWGFRGRAYIYPAASSGDDMLEKGFAGPDLSRDEETTCEAMLGEGEARLTVMPTHHINSLGDLIGFRFDCAPYLPGSSLPLVRTMFHGHTLVECQAKESDILRLMSHPEENQQCMKRFLQDVEAECVPATLDCVPENASALTSSGQVHAQGLRSVDSRRWTPEVPERIGIYHAYIRSYNRDARTHKLFISVTGGLSRASDAFCNLVSLPAHTSPSHAILTGGGR